MNLFVRELGVTPKCSICSNEILKTTEFSPVTKPIESLVTDHSAYRSLHQWLFDWILIQSIYWCTRTWNLAVASVGFGFSAPWYEILLVRRGREAMMIFSNWTRRRWLHCHNVSPFVWQLFEHNECKPQPNIGPPLIWGLAGFPHRGDWSWADELQWCVV